MPSIGDLLFALGQWLKTTPLPGFALWLSNTPPSAWVDASFWIAATVQTIHILAVAATFMSVLMINLRIVQLAGSGRTLAQTLTRYGPWVWWGLLVLLSTGLILVIGEPARELLNPCFWTKMVLVIAAAATAIWFQDLVRHRVGRQELTSHGVVAVRTGAAAVIGLWLVIMALGRWIAYAPV